jgi:hypothetical protein
MSERLDQRRMRSCEFAESLPLAAMTDIYPAAQHVGRKGKHFPVVRGHETEIGFCRCGTLKSKIKIDGMSAILPASCPTIGLSSCLFPRCEYIAFRNLWRVGYARVSHGDITDTELQVR